MKRYELTDSQWLRVRPLLPGQKDCRGVTAKDNRQFLNAVLWVACSGAPWRDLPPRYGKWNSVFQRFRRWSKKGVWDQVSPVLQESYLDTLVNHHAENKRVGRKTFAEIRRPGFTIAEATSARFSASAADKRTAAAMLPEEKRKSSRQLLRAKSSKTAA